MVSKLDIALVVLGVGVILLVASFFYGSGATGAATAQGDDVQVVEIGLRGGSYFPAVIEVGAGKPVILRSDGTLKGCSSFVVQRDLGISADLSGNREYQFVPQKRGTFMYTCSMGMYRGTIKVV